MFRYNAYFGIHTVYYMDLIEQYGIEHLPVGNILQAWAKTAIAKTLSLTKTRETVMNLWTRQLINKMTNLKFLSYIGEDGYPVIIPVIQAQTFGNDHVIFSISASDSFVEPVMRIDCSFPVPRSLAETFKIPSTSISKVTSICGIPLGAGSIPLR